jgi:hypothetical protein
MRFFIGILISVCTSQLGAETLSPSLTSPTSDSYQPSITVTYTLPEMPQANSVQLMIAGPVTSTLLLQNEMSGSFVIETDTNLSTPPQVQGASNVGPLVEGTYTFTLLYQDFEGNPSASVVATNVVLDESITVADCSSPSSDSSYENTFNLEYELPEAASEIRLRFLGASTNLTWTLDPSLTTLNETLNFSGDPEANDFVLSGTALSHSTEDPVSYDISLSYSDLAGNESPLLTKTNVALTITSPPTTPASTSSGCRLTHSDGSQGRFDWLILLASLMALGALHRRSLQA